MKKLLVSLLLFPTFAFAIETITIFSPYSPSHSGTPAMQKIIEVANNSQSDFKFILQFKPGGQQLIAIRELDKNFTNSLSVIAPKFVEHTESGKILKSDYIPVFALGDACWAVISNLGQINQGLSGLNETKDVVVGSVGIGNATHLTSLQIAEKYGLNIRYVVFKSNYDALILMVGKGEVNMVIERYSSYLQFKDKANLNVLAVSCPSRLPQAPHIKTLKEQGVEAPFIFNILIAHKNMDDEKRKLIQHILESATKTVGENEILKLSDMKPPIFSQIDIHDYYKNSLEIISKLLKKHSETIEAAQR